MAVPATRTHPSSRPIPLAQVSQNTLRRLRVPACLLAALLSVLPVMEILVNAWPVRIHDPAWRLAAVGIGAGGLATLLLALFLILVVGSLGDSPVGAWIVAGICALVAMVCVVGAFAFALDSLQVRAQVLPAMANRYGLASLLALGKICFAGIVATSFTFNAVGTARNLRRTVVRPARSASSILVGSARTSPPVVDSATELASKDSRR
jgi:hypothetical protein